jgi:hypothetical protein
MALLDETRNVIDALREALQRYDRLRFDELQARELGPPATPAELDGLEKAIGFPLPPSWKVFLSLHNGWSDFIGTSKLLSTRDIGSAWVMQRICEWEDLLEDRPSPFAGGRQPVLLGPDASSFLLVHPETRRNDGEMAFVMYDYLEEERRFQSLLEFLKHHLSVMSALIERLEERGRDAE